jgi:hypothetical protein
MTKKTKLYSTVMPPNVAKLKGRLSGATLNNLVSRPRLLTGSRQQPMSGMKACGIGSRNVKT